MTHRCLMCGLSSASHQLNMRHMITHIRSYLCMLCQERFYLAKDLEEHLCEHEDQLASQQNRHELESLQSLHQEDVGVQPQPQAVNSAQQEGNLLHTEGDVEVILPKELGVPLCNPHNGVKVSPSPLRRHFTGPKSARLRLTNRYANRFQSSSPCLTQPPVGTLGEEASQLSPPQLTSPKKHILRQKTLVASGLATLKESSSPLKEDFIHKPSNPRTLLKKHHSRSIVPDVSMCRSYRAPKSSQTRWIDNLVELNAEHSPTETGWCCTRCGKHFSGKKRPLLELHLLTHFKLPFHKTCKDCGLVLPDVKGLSDHRKEHHPRPSCQTCGRGFLKVRCLKEHEITCVKAKEVKPVIC